MTYEAILDFWKKQNIKNADELASVLSSYSVNFAYNSGKIENDEITYHDTREVFNKNGVTSYTGSTKTLFEIQNSKAAYERMLTAFDTKQTIDEEFLKEIQMILTNGTYDERRYQIGERLGEYKHHDYVTGKNRNTPRLSVLMRFQTGQRHPPWSYSRSMRRFSWPAGSVPWDSAPPEPDGWHLRSLHRPTPYQNR